MNQTFKENNSYNIMIRPHPVFPLSDAIDITGKPVFDFTDCSKKTLEECFAWADALLYVHSTVAIEALAKGIPIINMHIDNIFDPDPVIGFDALKWNAKGPLFIKNILDTIDCMPEKEFKERQGKAVKYVKRYFYPVSEEYLDRFLTKV